MEYFVSKVGSRLLTYDMKINKKVSYFFRGKGVKDVGVVNLILSNLLACVRKGHSLAYSRMTGTPPKGKRRMTARKIIRGVDFLVKEGYITNHVGKRSAVEEDRGISFISPTPKLLSLFYKDLNLIEEDILDAENSYLECLEVVIVRNEFKEIIMDDLINEKYFNIGVNGKEEMEEIVKTLNKVNNSATIVDGDGVILENSYCRVFNKSYNLGGRWYRADILRIKNKESKARLDITINGESVVEVDFRGMHFMIAAAMPKFTTDHEMPSDVYAFMLRDDDYSEVDYDVLKTSVNIMFNCNSQQESFSAINKMIRELPEEKKKQLSLTRAKFIAQIVEEDFPEVFSAMNGGIYDFGLLLQNADSKIAELIIKEFVDEGIPILPVHDSFLVQEKHLDKLLNAMGEQFRSMMDVTYSIPVKMQYKVDGELVSEEVMV